MYDKFCMNPFTEDQLRKINNLSCFFPDAIQKDVVTVFNIGKSQYMRTMCILDSSRVQPML